MTSDIREAARAVNNSLMRLIGPKDDEDPPPAPHIQSESDDNEANEKLEKTPL